MNSTVALTKLRDFFWNDPLLTIAIAAALVAFATTPIAFAVLGRMQWFKARRGRVMQRPEFASIVCAMLLVMGIPAIFVALVLKGQHFDKNRYEFDPNKTWSVLDQGRSFRDVKEADEAVRREMERLAGERKRLVDNVKKLDEAMLALRAVAGTSPAVAQTIPNVLQRLAGLRESVGVDGPQQLMDFTAPPVELANIPASPAPTTVAVASVAPAAAPAAVVKPSVRGLTQAQVDAELALVPDPQRGLAAMLPLTDLPEGWIVGKSGERYVETFNAENLYEKIDGRAESFIDYKVRGMAYTNYQPAGDDSNEIQLYIFEMSDPINALGKFRSERPEGAQPLEVGSEGYTSAGSTMFYADRYYTQIVSTKDDPKFSAFALELAHRIVAKQKPSAAPATSESGETVAAAAAPTPETFFAMLPKESGRANPNYAPADVFGYSFLSSVFLADYSEGEATWQGFLRPYADAKEAHAVFDQYLETAKKDGAEVKTVDVEGADKMVICANIGLTDVIFVRDNVIGGANGATDAKPAEAFARAFAKNLPKTIPAIESPKPAAAVDEGGEK